MWSLFRAIYISYLKVLRVRSKGRRGRLLSLRRHQVTIRWRIASKSEELLQNPESTFLMLPMLSLVAYATTHKLLEEVGNCLKLLLRHYVRGGCWDSLSSLVRILLWQYCQKLLILAENVTEHCGLHLLKLVKLVLQLLVLFNLILIQHHWLLILENNNFRGKKILPAGWE